MPVNEEAEAEATKRPARGHGGQIVFLAVLIALIVGAAYFQEEIGYFFQLQAWNPGKAGQTVVSFLQAGREGKKEEADRCIDTNLFHPLEQEGKFVGYQMGTTVGTQEYRFSELAGPGEIHPAKNELVFKGSGAAMVTVPDASGSPTDYRLVMQGGSWQISEIRAGRLRK